MASSEPRPSVVEAMTEAATNLLDALSPEQRQRATWPFPSDEERRRWFYTPTDHGGLPLADMDSAQHRLVHQLLATGLSEAGYVTASVVLGLENILDRVEGFRASFGRPRGRDPLMYWIAFFGRPGADATWGWRFGGHHISLHFTLAGGRVVSTTPCFFGADPAAAPLLGPHLHRPLAGVEDLARELVRSLDQEQAARAVVAPVAPVDLVGVNRTTLSEGDRPLPLPEIWRGRLEADLDRAMAEMQQRAERELGLVDEHLEALAFSAAPKGLPATELRPEQREILHALLLTYVGRIHDDLADEQAARITGSGLDALSFLWAGGTEPDQPHYYRVQGNQLFVEYDNTQRNVNHIHSVWRDLSLDFGGDPLAEHYVAGHH